MNAATETKAHDLLDAEGRGVRELRNLLGQFATGVTVITTRTADGRNVGVTANSFSSLSLSPALVLWSLARTAPSLKVFAQRATSPSTCWARTSTTCRSSSHGQQLTSSPV